MSNVEAIAMPAQSGVSLWRQALVWVGSSIVAVPVSIILHELGHRLAHLIFGFQGSTLHYSSTTYGVERAFWQQVYRGDFQAAAGILPLWQAALSSAAGLFASYAVILVCCYLAARRKPYPLAIAIGIVSPLRFISGVPTLLAWFSGKPVRSGTDEANLALLSGIPVILLIALGLALLIGGWFWLIRHIPKTQRSVALAGLVVGIPAGFFLYFRLIGPWLLP